LDLAKVAFDTSELVPIVNALESGQMSVEEFSKAISSFINDEQRQKNQLKLR
jgi:hypothetical protein